MMKQWFTLFCTQKAKQSIIVFQNNSHEASSIIEIMSPVEAENATNRLDITSKSLNSYNASENAKRDVIAYYQKWSPTRERKICQTLTEKDFNKRKSSLKKHGSQNSTEFSSQTIPHARSR